jgi:UDP:flavonoid glycosyltransferase YjiC (YdhE family)
MRVMFASTRGAGHLAPVLPLADACKRSGHQVLVAGPRALADCVARHGHAFWPVDDPDAGQLAAVRDSLPALAPAEQNRVVTAEIFGRLNAGATLARHRAACREWRPDVIVRESSEFGSAVAAELAGIPHARIGTGLAATEERAITAVAPALDAVRVAHGLPSDPDGEALRAAPYFTWFPESLEEPGTPCPPHTVRLRDPHWEAWPIPLPASWWHGATDPLVYVSFGAAARDAALFPTAMRALGGLPIRVLMTVGADIDVAALPQAPGNVHIERWVPQHHVLPHAAAVVCHAGSGTTLGALAAGRPLVTVPLFADQPDNARRVAETGAGRTPSAPDATTLREAVLDVLENRSFTAAAAKQAKELRTHLVPSAALPMLAELAAAELSAAA